MLSLQAPYKLELRTEELGELRGIVAFDGQTAAPIGTLGGESGYDDVPSDLESRSNRVKVGLAVGLFGQEVKDSPVVPYVDLAGQTHVPRIGGNPRDLVCSLSQTGPGRIDSGRGDIHDDYIVTAAFQESVNETGRPASDIDYGGIPRRRNCAD